jgi:WD40 repeat protein
MGISPYGSHNSLRMLTNTFKKSPNFAPLQVYKSTDYRRITNLTLSRNKHLISGDTSGNVRVRDVIEDSETKHDCTKSNLEQYPHLSIRFKIPAAHGGTIENIRVIGNILLTTGGSDGFIRGYDLKQGDLIGAVSCHQGMPPR